ncbi:MAG: hypothetical protein ABEK75_04140 [Salinibacter sp.]
MNEHFPPARTIIRRLLGGLVGLGGLALVCSLLLRIVVDAEALERRLNPALDAAAQGNHEVAIDEVEWGLLAQSLQVSRVTLEPDSQAMEDHSASRAETASVRATVPTLRLQDLHWWTLLWHQTLSFDDVLVRGPQVHIQSAAGTGETEAAGATAAPDSTGAEAGGLGLQVQQLRVEEGTLSRGPAGSPARDSLWGLSLQFGPLSREAASGTPLAELFADRLSEGGVEGYRHLGADAPYTLRLGPVHVSPSDSVLRVEDAEFLPSVSDEAFQQQYTYRVNRYRVTVEQVSVAGFDADRFAETGALHAARVRVDTLDLSVYRDNHPPEDPNDPPPPMPQEAIEQLDRSLRIDTLRVRDSRIQYTKRPEGVPASGSISFEDLWASLYNLTNVPDRMTASTPAVVEARTRVNGAGRLSTTISVPLRSDGVNGSFGGRVEAMDPRALNETFVPLGGVRIESGHVDSLWFQADLEAGTATGRVGGVYRNLEIETLDPATGERGLGDRLKTIAGGLALRSKNLPADGDLDTGQIQHTRAEGDSYFKFLWHALRSGIYSLVGIDRLPR